MKSNELLGLFVRKQFNQVIDNTKDKGDPLSSLLFTEASVILDLPVETNQQTILMKAIKFYNNQEYYKAREIIESNMVDGFELLSVYVKTMAELKDSSVIDYLESSSLQRDQVEQLIRQYELYCNAVIEEFDDLEEETIDGPQEPKKESIEQEETTSKPTDQEPNHMDGEMSSVNNTPVNQPEKHLDNKKAPIYPKVILEFIRDLGVPIGIILSLIFYFLNRNTNGRLGRLISQFEQRVKNTFKMAIAK